MKNKLIMLLIVGMFMISFASAETETYKINTKTNLQFTCTLDNAIPTSATFNITITDKEGNYLINNQLTNELGNGAFNYTTTFPKAVNIQSSKCFVLMGLILNSNEGYYNITPSGFSGTLGFYILILDYLLE